MFLEWKDVFFRVEIVVCKLESLIQDSPLDSKRIALSVLITIPIISQVAECVAIMNNILELLFSKDIGPIENDVRDLMLILLRTIIQSSIAMDRDNPLVGNLVAIMLAIFRNMTEMHYKMYVNHFATRFDLMDFLTEILLVFKELVSKPVFPCDWLDMIMHQNTVILESLRNFAQIIKDKFFDPFEKQVWSNFFHCSIAFLIQPALQLDQFTGNKTSVILSRYCDIRRETAAEICNMWYNLGEHKIMFVPGMVGPFLEMSMIPETELRKSTIPIFFDMMQCEYVSSKFHTESFGDTKRNVSHMKASFRDFEKEMIEKIDILVEGGRGDFEFKELFSEIMINLCSNHVSLRHEGTIFVNMATKLMERLLEYRFLINDESKENRMSCTVSLLQFYEEVNRKEMYIRYVNKLTDLHMEFDNNPEAAFTLKLHSKLLHWNDTHLPPLLKSCRHPHCITHRHLKEELYKEIIRLFDDGKMWEYALEVCKELAQQYEYEIFDYIGLSQLHIQMSQFYRKYKVTQRLIETQINFSFQNPQAKSSLKCDMKQNFSASRFMVLDSPSCFVTELSSTEAKNTNNCHHLAREFSTSIHAPS
jgi:dedicator of cytokinesis protein 1